MAGGSRVRRRDVLIQVQLYDTTPDSPTLGCPLDGPPHTIYLDPGDQPSLGDCCGGGGAEGESSRPTSKGRVMLKPLNLNHGAGLRPADDACGWK
eukprot:6415711-Prymnesium_polylepis.2